jgi:hypothetical protein
MSGLLPASHPVDTVLIDSGVMARHPWLVGVLLPGANFTSEGPTDYYGHGTMMALTTVYHAPAPPRLRPVKVVEADGRGSPSRLIQGLNWTADLARANPSTKVTVTAALGVYGMRRSRFTQCRGGDCDVCRAALDAVAAGAWISAAAGNTPGMTACPARAGLESGTGILAVGTTPERGGRARFYAGGADQSIAPVLPEAPNDSIGSSRRGPADVVALAALSRAAALGDAMAACSLGTLHMRRGERVRGREAWARAVRMGSLEAAHNLGHLALHEGDFTTAEKLLSRAIKSNAPRTFRGLGLALEQQGRYRQAMRAFEAAVARGNDAASADMQRVMRELGSGPRDRSSRPAR